ncbi:MAG: hypothetical protein JSS96_12265 [Bacteroidetes bacterium]|nr:hypothetical protein [Bacteroidota bacterium]
MKSSQQSQARDLYLNTGLSQKEIAQYVAVSEKTIYLWIKQQSWDKLKQASLAAPAMIVDNLFSQLVELQNHIATREEGNRFPTLHEAEITRKLIQCIDKLKLYPSQGACMQMMRGYIDFIGTGNETFRNQTLQYTKEYLQGRSINGYAPYDIAYKAKSPQDILQEIKDAPELKEEVATVSTNTTDDQEISVPEIISEPEIPQPQSAETPAAQTSSANEPADNKFPSPEKIGNSSTSSENNSEETPPSDPDIDNEFYRQREILRILDQMKATNNNRNNKRHW